MEQKQNEAMSFEMAMARLEEIVRALESGNTPLDTSLSLFEEGVALVRLCNARLDNAQQRGKILTVGADGSVTEQAMPPMPRRLTRSGRVTPRITPVKSMCLPGMTITHIAETGTAPHQNGRKPARRPPSCSSPPMGSTIHLN